MDAGLNVHVRRFWPFGRSERLIIFDDIVIGGRIPGLRSGRNRRLLSSRNSAEAAHQLPRQSTGWPTIAICDLAADDRQLEAFGVLQQTAAPGGKIELYEETVVKNTFCVSFPVRLPAPLPPYSDPIDWLRSFRGQLMHNPCIDLYPVEAEAAYHNPYSHPRIEQRRMRTKLLLGVSRRHQSSRSRIAPTRVALLSLLQHRHQTARSSAPCGTSPVSTKRQSAISNFRASATIPTLAARPPFPLKRLRYQTANSLLG